MKLTISDLRAVASRVLSRSAKVLEDAIEKLRRLPEDRQANAAEVLEQIAAVGSEVFVVPERHRAAVLDGLAQAERSEFMTDDDMTALWNKCGL